MLKTAIKAAKLAGKLILSKRKHVGKIKAKEHIKSIVTDADIAAEKIIIKTIKEKYPDHNFLGEELGTENHDSPYTWIIDPIDGTTNFPQDIPMYVVSIGLKKEETIILGVVYNPNTKELYHAVKGKGAYLNNKKITVSQKTKLSDTVNAMTVPSETEKSLKTFDLLKKVYPNVRGMRLYGTSALILCYLASGKLDGYFTYSIKPWDVAAGILIVRESGGKITDIKGNKWNIYEESLLVTNGRVHNQFLKILK